MTDQKTQAAQATDQVFAAFNRFAALGTQQMLTAIQSSQPLIDAYMGMLRSVAVLPMTTIPAYQSAASSLGAAMPSYPSLMPSVSAMMPKTTCCEIPETACPPRCVCVIAWHAARGEDVKATIALTNTANKAQVFDIAATTFEGPSGDTGVAATVAPASVNLNANQSATITVTLHVSDTFETGNAYTAEVTLTGQYEQCVQLSLTVCTKRTHHCTVRQGDIPTHIRAHRWYDHFQCEEPCFEPATPRDPSRPHDPNTPHG